MCIRTLTPTILAVLLPTLVFAEEQTGAWAISVDNDLFGPTRSDRDYTAGTAFTYSGPEVEGGWNLLNQSLRALNRLFLSEEDENTPKAATAFEVGLYGFTPNDLSRSDVMEDDRPYSSLAYLSSSRSYFDTTSDNGWTTSLTIGMLGLDLFEAAQNAVHPLVGSDSAKGWDHQVSEGGELTFRYGVAYHEYLDQSRPDSQFKRTYFASIGYLTEAGVALVFRDGLISSPDNRFNPELSTYGERSPMSAMEGSQESYFWGGIALKGRLYNAFLEGQFRRSEHKIDRSDLRYWLAEAWLGYTHSFFEHYKFSYFVRVQSSEIQGGEGDRGLVWGGVVLSRTY